jgi:hypothetical protein
VRHNKFFNISLRGAVSVWSEKDSDMKINADPIAMDIPDYAPPTPRIKMEEQR